MSRGFRVGRVVIAIGVSVVVLQARSVAAQSPFIVQPYLQLGDVPSGGERVAMDVMWHTDTTAAQWGLEVRPSSGGAGAPWSLMRTVRSHRVAAPGFPVHVVWEGTLGELVPGAPFEYRVTRNGAVVFMATGRARKTGEEPYRVVVFGDGGVDGAGQKAVAYQAYKAHPDLVAIAGDIVYGAGRMSEYRTNFYPIYNADSAGVAVGAPLARSVPFVAALGNHDAIEYEPGQAIHDELAFFAYWSMPLNGPYGKPGRNATPVPDDSVDALSVAAAIGGRYPRMANYSFDYGNAHWTVLDANPYVDWTDPILRNWVAQDLAKARGATWRFVMFHEPGFNSSKAHFSEQQMRLLSDVFEAGGVDIVFQGHVHNYQRSYPLRFLPDLLGDEKTLSDGRLHSPDESKTPFTINGELRLDKHFDGVQHTVPQGIIYIVSGAGGAGLYTPEQTTDPASWQSFTKIFIADRYSLSVVDVNGRTLTFRQVDERGAEIDRFVMTKPSVLAAERAIGGVGRGSAGQP
jgi:hypothetical protein